jgi:uncharacterized protein YgbK (DUF1537 family)
VTALLAVAAVAGGALGWRLTLAWVGGERQALLARATRAEDALKASEARAAGERRAREAVEAHLAATLASLPKGAGLAMLRGEQDE